MISKLKHSAQTMDIIHSENLALSNLAQHLVIIFEKKTNNKSLISLTFQ